MKLCTLLEEQEQLAEESHKIKEEIKVETKAQKNQEVRCLCFPFLLVIASSNKIVN